MAIIPANRPTPGRAWGVLVLMLLCSNFQSACCSSSSSRSIVDSDTKWTTNPPEIGSLTILESVNRTFALILQRGAHTGPCIAGVYHQPSDLQLWVANFNSSTPTASIDPNQTCTFELRQDGNLVLMDGNKTSWSSHTQGLLVQKMQLLESGNLILLRNTSRDLNRDNITSGNTTAVVWQSFEHPADTLLPGQKLMANITMFAAAIDAPYMSGGIYSMLVSRYSNDMLLYADFNQPSGPEQYWSMEQTFSIPQNAWVCCYGAYAELGNGLAVYDSTSEIIVQTSSNNLNPNKTLLEYARLKSDGNLETYVFKDGQWRLNFQAFTNLCQLPDSCGPCGVCSTTRGSSNGSCTGCLPGFHLQNTSNPKQGCTTSEPVAAPCSSRGIDSTAAEVVNMTGYGYFSFQNFYTGEGQAAINYSSSSFSDCQGLCIRNCSCYAAFFSDKLGCYIVEHGLRTIRKSDDLTQMLLLKLPKGFQLAPAPAPITGQSGLSPANKSPVSTVNGVRGGTNSPANGPSSSQEGIVPAHPKERNRPIIFIAVASGGGGALVVCLILLGFIRSGRKARKRKFESAKDELFLDKLPGLPPRFTYKDLHVATNGFSKTLGAGGFGTVYEGVLLGNAERVAVKKLERIGQGMKEFRAEVATIGSISHVNLVRLRGFCMEGSHRLLVYEYMANGSLNKVSGALDWSARHSIALGTARGLAYLHDECTSRIIHCDIKPENILLDEHWVAKVSDFGLAKLMSRDESYRMTTMRGTRGYLAPEWLKNAPITEKSDAFSYGILLLELVSGRRSFEASMSEAQRCYLPAWAFSLLEKGGGDDALLQILDEKMGVDDKEQACSTIKVALWCIQEEAAARPTMTMVARMLEGEAAVPDPPVSYYFAKADPMAALVDRGTIEEEDEEEDRGRMSSPPHGDHHSLLLASQPEWQISQVSPR